MSKVLLTPLHRQHLDLGARMMVFGGFDMPVQYSGIIKEHLAVRERVGIFDVSHMGEIELRGKDALPFADYMLTNKVGKMKDGDVRYSPLCYHHGGQVDDLFIYRLKENFVLLVVNASPDYSRKDFDWLEVHRGNFEVEIINRSPEYGMLAVQGPASQEVLQPLIRLERETLPRDLRRFKSKSGRLGDKEILISRTGYTGEDGFEIYSETKDIAAIWKDILESGQRWAITPCGLGARDTTRFEVGYWLYGNDCDETINPLESGQGWAVKFDKRDFVGKDALLKLTEQGLRRKLVGLYISTGGIPRHGMEVRKNGQKIGYITSGNYCPSLKKVYAMALIRLADTEKGNIVHIMIRNKAVEAEVVDLPFLQPINKRRT